MQSSQIPAKFNIPFANNASAPYIRQVPQASQTGITPGAASLYDGFPPLNFQPIAAGGIPPFGQDMNGLLNQSTAWNQWHSAGGPILYDPAFQTAIGGYPNGAIVGSLIVQGNYWMSTVDNNLTNPDAGGAGWIVPPSMMGTGHWQHRPVSDAIPGWIIANGTTIGNVGSAATQRANADCAFAYAYFWNKFSNTQCPVTGGRGANAAADFAAGKPIATLNMQGTGIIGVDGMGGTPTGLLNGVPVVSGGATIPGSVLGENLHALIVAELAAHNHGVTDPTHKHNLISAAFGANNSLGYISTTSLGTNVGGGGAFGGFDTFSIANAATGISINSNGSGTAHNNVQRSMLVYWFMKL